MPFKPYHLLFGSFFAMTAVILGAFGAHALDGVLTQEQLKSFETGVRYQMYHALILVIIALKGHSFRIRNELLITGLFSLGILLFSGSIYLLNLQYAWDMDLKWLGPVTPAGGALLIIAWGMLFVEAIRLCDIQKR